MSKDVNVEIKIDNGGAEDVKVVNTAQEKYSIMRDMMAREAFYGKSVPLYPGEFVWPSPKPASPMALYLQSRGRATRPSIIPTFVEPERPAPAPEPQPEPDSPAVAVLRKLLADRQRVVEAYEGEIKDTAEDIAHYEKRLAEKRADLEHEKTCAAAAQAEVDAIKADIVKLGGTVAED